VELAQSLLDLASSRKTAGTGTGIEVVRAQVQLANEEQLLLAAQDDHQQALLRLRWITGLDYQVDVRLADTLELPPPVLIGVDEAIEAAMRSRSDLLAQQERVNSAELAYSSARWRRLPSLNGFADYGTIGTDTGSKLPTWTAGLTLQIPLFEGGAIEAQRGQLAAELRRQKLLLEELTRQLELEVRLAHKAMLLSATAVRVAGEGVDLAGEEMARARRRYQAGVVTSLETTDAQSRLKRAEDNRIGALSRYNLARVGLWEAMGAVRTLMLE
jgi:outer membrane protein TolC